MSFENLTDEELLMLDWAVYNEITRYIRQGISSLSPRQRFKYENLESLRQKITLWVEEGVKKRSFAKNG
tara:strand:+ start:1036 stop:1242 length:207 start_codon:yes stop_codon:yes gene_type:complete